MLADPIPRGFEVLPTECDGCTLRYRTTGMRAVGCFFTCWLSVWAVGCALVTYGVIANGCPSVFTAAWLVGAWINEVGSLAYVAWYYGSATTFRFARDKLSAERSIWGYRRRREFPRDVVRAVVQVKDGGEGGDSFPSWGLVVVGTTRTRVLSRQPVEASDWLGPVIARWADAPFEPWGAAEPDWMETL